MDSRSAELTINDFNTPIRVLLDKGSRTARVRSTLNHLYLKEGNEPGWTTLDSEAYVSIGRKNAGHVLMLNGVALSAPTIYLRGGPRASDILMYKTDRFRGALKLTLARGGFLVANVLPLEDYLVGTLPSEMSPSWEMEALKAQAVASRTYAYYMTKHPKHALYDLDRSIQDQVYGGADGENDRVRRAVSSTAGEFLGDGGEPVKAFYHSRCGGTTETAHSVWRDGSHLSPQRVTCPYCQRNPYVWRVAVDLDELFHLMNMPLDPTVPVQLTSLERTPSGRVARLKLGSGSREKILTSDQFRSLVGYTRIKSAFFDWKLEDRTVIFEGIGSGHGVGMCQWGARYLARQGKNYAQILGHYYPGIALYGIRETVVAK